MYPTALTSNLTAGKTSPQSLLKASSQEGCTVSVKFEDLKSEPPEVKHVEALSCFLQIGEFFAILVFTWGKLELEGFFSRARKLITDILTSDGIVRFLWQVPRGQAITPQQHQQRQEHQQRQHQQHQQQQQPLQLKVGQEKFFLLVAQVQLWCLYV